ncbi:MAG: hypothetical protein WC178_00150 [Candidatus Paceibacterota bacterium]
MSKKNKNKYKATVQRETSEDKNKIVSEKPEDKAAADFKNEFKHLAITIVFILLILVGLYYYDQQNHILQDFADKLLNF